MILSAIVTDIEGTTTPIAFVQDELFPYARARLPAFLQTHADSPEVAACVAEAQGLSDGRPVLDALLAWMDDDAKVAPLKALQGLIWADGYASGELVGRLYPDVAPALREWHARGLHLAIYSSGSEAAQRLIFAHSDAGDLSGCFGSFFDTRVGAKREPDSYRRISERIAVPAGGTLFLSDVEAELDAAALAGMLTTQLVRPQDGTMRSSRHPADVDFTAVGNRIASLLPARTDFAESRR